jgi:hypothetical protein
VESRQGIAGSKKESNRLIVSPRRLCHCDGNRRGDPHQTETKPLSNE